MKHCSALLLTAWTIFLLSGCTSTILSPPTATPTATSIPATTLSGFVFRDLDANGRRDQREPGEPNIIVSVYDADDNLVASTATDVNGDYVLNAALDSDKIIQGVDYVVIFSGWPAHMAPGPHGPDSGTEMQFVVGGATNVNFGLFNPDQYVAPKQTTESDAEN